MENQIGIWIKRVPVFLLLVFLLNSCNKIINADKTVEPVQVAVQVIDETGEASSQNYVGTVEASSSSPLSFSVAGNVIRVYVREGQRVAQGTLLAELDETGFQESYSAASATLRQAQDSYDRLKQLYQKGSITDVQWVEMETKLAQAKAAEAIAKRNVDNCKLYAPFSGVIGQCNIENGMNVMPGLAAFTLLKTDRLRVNIPIPENVISGISIGRPAVIQVAALGNRIYRGKVESKGVVANPLSHNYEVFVPVANTDGQLMPGMVCSVQMPASDTTHLITLSNATVKIARDGSHFVWIVKNGQAEQRPVITGGLSQKGIVISSGLSCGDSVIVSGEQKVSTGSKVIIR